MGKAAHRHVQRSEGKPVSPDSSLLLSVKWGMEGWPMA